MNLCDFFYEEISPGVQRVRGFFPDEFVGLQTTRIGGACLGADNSFNLATHVGDAPEAVARNRERLVGLLPNEPVWLEQVHGCESIVIARNAEGVTWQSADGGLPRGLGVTRADASFTAEPNQPCAILTADCLPLLVARPATGQCAAIHAGWKGLAAGVIENTLQRLLDQRVGGESVNSPSPNPWYIWLGPAIGQNAFEVGPEVRKKFVQHNAQAAAAFLASPRREGQFMASLQQLALLRLKTFESVNPGCEIRVAIAQECVFENPQKYFSYRRDGITGRMASLIFRRIGYKT